jgi:ectoine hydroxylase-related dioxygenase (phytanoyl-CoA dioxygenase family)
VVTPGGQAQQPHRDYHLGFQSDEVAARFPLPMHRLSQNLTLQGAVAHTDMPLETGPTLLLPFSQHYELGYLAWRDPAFIDYFASSCDSGAVEQGRSAVLQPGAVSCGGHQSHVDQFRMANLLQISSAFGKPMETVNRERMMLALYPLMLTRLQQGELDEEGMQAVIAMSADGYSFPTNLDTDPPLHGMAPLTGQQLMEQALHEGWEVQTVRRRGGGHARLNAWLVSDHSDVRRRPTDVPTHVPFRHLATHTQHTVCTGR